jgi:hypothetical protein
VNWMLERVDAIVAWVSGGHSIPQY